MGGGLLLPASYREISDFYQDTLSMGQILFAQFEKQATDSSIIYIDQLVLWSKFFHPYGIVKQFSQLFITVNTIPFSCNPCYGFRMWQCVSFNSILHNIHLTLRP